MLSAPHTARVPDGLSATVAATLPVAGTTAVDALDQLGLPAGATVLVNGVGAGSASPSPGWPSGAGCG